MFFVLGMAKSGVDEVVENSDVDMNTGIEQINYNNPDIVDKKSRAHSYSFADSDLPPTGQRVKYSTVKWVQVPQGYKLIKLGLGGKLRKDSVCEPGIRFVSSFGGWMGSLVFVNMKRDYIDVSTQEVATNEPFQIGIDGVIHFRVDNPIKAVLEETNYKNRLEQLAMQAIRGKIGSGDIFGALACKGRNIDYDSTEFDRMGVEVYSLGIKDIDIPDELEDKISAVGQAKLNKQALILEAEGEAEAARKLKEVAEIYGATPVVAYIRYLESMVKIAEGGKSSFVFAPGMFDLSRFGEFMSKFKV